MNRFENWVVDTPAWIVIPTMTAVGVLAACTIGIPIGLWITS